MDHERSVELTCTLWYIYLQTTVFGDTVGDAVRPVGIVGHTRATLEYGRWHGRWSGDRLFASPDRHAQVPSLDGCIHVLTTSIGADMYH